MIKTLLVDNRYEIFFNNKSYVIYDTLEAQDIPLYLFKIADKIIEMRILAKKRTNWRRGE